MKNLKKWWQEDGFRELNIILIGGNPLLPKRLKKIGNVPISNLMSIPFEEYDADQLASLISEEGIPAVAVNTVGNDREVLLKI